MKDMERIKIDKGFVEKQIPLTKTLKELADICGCGKDKIRHFIIDNGLYQYYCKQHHIKYDPSKENRKCCVCGYDKNISTVKGLPYCKRHGLQIHRYGKIIEKTIYDSNDIIVEDSIARIVLRGKNQEVTAETIIDSDDVDKIKDYKWYYSGGYCVTKGINPNTGVDISNVIFNDFKNKFDHISHDRLDNRKCNLRPVTSHQNAMNMGMKNTNTSGVTGVSKQLQKRKWTGRWCSVITFNYKSIWLGSYNSFNDAVDVRIMAEAALFGEYSPHYNPETNTVRLTYISQDDGQEYFCEYTLNGEKINDYKIAA